VHASALLLCSFVLSPIMPNLTNCQREARHLETTYFCTVHACIHAQQGLCSLHAIVNCELRGAVPVRLRRQQHSSSSSTSMSSMSSSLSSTHTWSSSSSWSDRETSSLNRSSSLLNSILSLACSDWDSGNNGNEEDSESELEDSNSESESD
jgi:hypothetical protein